MLATPRSLGCTTSRNDLSRRVQAYHCWHCGLLLFFCHDLLDRIWRRCQYRLDRVLAPRCLGLFGTIILQCCRHFYLSLANLSSFGNCGSFGTNVPGVIINNVGNHTSTAVLVATARLGGGLAHCLGHCCRGGNE